MPTLHPTDRQVLTFFDPLLMAEFISMALALRDARFGEMVSNLQVKILLEEVDEAETEGYALATVDRIGTGCCRCCCG